MTDRVAHDHPTVETIEAKIDRQGGTTRPEVVVEDTLEVDSGTLVRFVLDGSEYRTLVEQSGKGTAAFRHIAPTPTAARNPGSDDNVLPEWISSRDLDIGRSLHLDVVDSGFRYGLRAPGEEATYEVSRPDESLITIAQQLGLPDEENRR